nr:PREDICTED: proline-rich receptor-like protein kinase PERK9 [Apteryx mantelli mantelli]
MAATASTPCCGRASCALPGAGPPPLLPEPAQRVPGAALPETPKPSGVGPVLLEPPGFVSLHRQRPTEPASAVSCAAGDLSGAAPCCLSPLEPSRAAACTARDPQSLSEQPLASPETSQSPPEHPRSCLSSPSILLEAPPPRGAFTPPEPPTLLQWPLHGLSPPKAAPTDCLSGCRAAPIPPQLSEPACVTPYTTGAHLGPPRDCLHCQDQLPEPLDSPKSIPPPAGAPQSATHTAGADWNLPGHPWTHQGPDPGGGPSADDETAVSSLPTTNAPPQPSMQQGSSSPWQEPCTTTACVSLGLHSDLPGQCFRVVERHILVCLFVFYNKSGFSGESSACLGLPAVNRC